MTRGDGYANVSVQRPAVGVWRLWRGDRSPACAVGAFVRSPLELRLSLLEVVEKGPVTAEVRARFDRRVLRPPTLRVESTWTDRLAVPDGLDPDRDAERLAVWLSQTKPRSRALVWRGRPRPSRPGSPP